MHTDGSDHSIADGFRQRGPFEGVPVSPLDSMVSF